MQENALASTRAQPIDGYWSSPGHQYDGQSGDHEPDRQRLSRQSDGGFVLRFKRPLADRTTDVRLSPMELMPRLAALVPPRFPFHRLPRDLRRAQPPPREDRSAHPEARR